MKKTPLLALALVAVGCGPPEPPTEPPPDGPFEEYHDNGQLESKGTYKDGEREGPFETYYENGQLREKGTLKDNEKCGEWLEEGETVTYPPC